MKANIGAKVYSMKGELLKKFNKPDKLPNDKEEEKELFEFYKKIVRTDKKIDISEVDKIVCQSFINPTEIVVFKRNKVDWVKEVIEK